jgi:hypothetical protein
MKHYVTGYKPGEDEQIFKIMMPLDLAKLREIMQWPDNSYCAYDNELNEVQVQKIESASGIILPKNLDLFLTTESD